MTASMSYNHVLLIEDSPDYLSTLKILLQVENFQVTTAIDGLDGLDKLTADPSIGTIFSDIGLPHGLSGLQLARAVRKVRPETHVVLGTAHLASAVKGMAGYDDSYLMLYKPYEMGQLYQLLRAIPETALKP